MAKLLPQFAEVDDVMKGGIYHLFDIELGCCNPLSFTCLDKRFHLPSYDGIRVKVSA
jgi:hypothetical protein